MTLDRATVEDRLEEYVLDLLDGEESRAVEEALIEHLDLSDRVEALRRGLEAMVPDDPALPADLRSRVFGAVAERRVPGRGEGVEAPASGRDCRLHTVEMVSTLLDELDDGDLAAPTIYGVPVVELVSHLIGVEDDLGRTVAASDEPIAFGSATPATHREVRDASDPANGSQVMAAWRRTSGTVTELLAEQPAELLQRRVELVGTFLPIEELLVVRAFELWSHVEDICRATDRGLRLPPPDVLHPMAALATRLGVSLVDRVGSRVGTTVRVTLTGPGGGSWVHRIDRSGVIAGPDAVEAADATLVVDVIDFCRLAADRAPGGIERHHSGDRRLVDELVSRLPTLADYGAEPLPR